MTFDMATIAEAITSLKTASETVKTIKSLFRTSATSKEAEEKISELQGIILSAYGSAVSAQMGQLSMIQSIRELEAQIAKFETWESEEKPRYQMKDINPGRGGVFVYALKEDAAATEPHHYLCARCFQHRIKSPLQGSPKIEKGQRVHFCPECRTEFAFSSASAQSGGNFVLGETCPSCGEPRFRVQSAVPHPAFGVMGKTIHQLKCDACGFTDQRMPK